MTEAYINTFRIIFIFSFLLVFYTYIGYGILLKFINSRKNHQSKDVSPEFRPSLSIIVAAYNEEQCLDEKIRNIFELDYPASLIEVIIVTDGSTDGSSRIIQNYPSIKHLHQVERKGKVAASNRAVAASASEILIFSDANTLMNKESVINLIRHYADPKVGGVAGEKKVYQNSGKKAAAVGEGVYWKYESFLKREDSRFYSTVGAAGEIFSIRRHLYENLPENTVIEDFVQSLRLCLKGYVVRYEPGAFAAETASISISEEMKRKIRICAGAFQAMGMLKPLFNFFRYPELSFQFISHRVLRWTLAPVALILLYVSNLFLFLEGSSVFYRFVFYLQTTFYLLALAGYIFRESKNSPRIISLPFYFVFMNLAVFIGFYRFMTKTQTVLWDKAKREKGAGSIPV